MSRSRNVKRNHPGLSLRGREQAPRLRAHASRCERPARAPARDVRTPAFTGRKQACTRGPPTRVPIAPGRACGGQRGRVGCRERERRDCGGDGYDRPPCEPSTQRGTAARGIGGERGDEQVWGTRPPRRADIAAQSVSSGAAAIATMASELGCPATAAAAAPATAPTTVTAAGTMRCSSRTRPLRGRSSTRARSGLSISARSGHSMRAGARREPIARLRMLLLVPSRCGRDTGADARLPGRCGGRAARPPRCDSLDGAFSVRLLVARTASRLRARCRRRPG